MARKTKGYKSHEFCNEINCDQWKYVCPNMIGINHPCTGCMARQFHEYVSSKGYLREEVNLPTIFDVLQQDELWVSRAPDNMIVSLGTHTKIVNMDDRHLVNVIKLLTRNAMRIYSHAICSSREPRPKGGHCEITSREWLFNTPFFKAAMKEAYIRGILF